MITRGDLYWTIKMRLTELDPHWCSTGGKGITDKDGKPVPLREKIGLVCDCPRCGPDHPLFVPFANPFDGGAPRYEVTWQRTGDAFETLTLRPSILRNDCGWHGFITNGAVETV